MVRGRNILHVVPMLLISSFRAQFIQKCYSRVIESVIIRGRRIRFMLVIGSFSSFMIVFVVKLLHTQLHDVYNYCARASVSSVCMC